MIIGFIGAGAMGGALIEGFIKSGIEYTNIIASVKTMEKKDYLEKNLGIKVYTDNRKVASEADVLFIALIESARDVCRVINEDFDDYLNRCIRFGSIDDYCKSEVTND